MTSPPPKWSDAFIDYLNKREEIFLLLKASPPIEEQLVNARARKFANAILNSSVVLASSQLESYFESLVRETIEILNVAHLAKNKIDPRLVTVQAKNALSTLIEDLEREIPKENMGDSQAKIKTFLAKHSWYLQEETAVFDTMDSEALVGGNRFSNPKPDRINDLFLKLGIKSVVKQAIAFESTRRDVIELKVAELIDKRNAVAHLGQVSEIAPSGQSTELTRESVVTYLECARRLVRCVDIVVGRKVESMIGRYPWVNIK